MRQGDVQTTWGASSAIGLHRGGERWKEDNGRMHTVLIVNIDATTRQDLAQWLTRRSDIDRVMIAESMPEMDRAIAEGPIDLVIAGVDALGCGVRELLSSLSAEASGVAAFVVISEGKDHALDAFEHEAADYLVKPLSAERFSRAIEAGFRQKRTRTISKMVNNIHDLQSMLTPPPPRIMAKVEGKFVAINPAEIMFVKAEGNYVLLEGTPGRLLLREAMHEIERKLERYGFLRIHRSIIVNSAFVLEFQPCSTGEYSLTLRNGKKFTVTRTYKKNLRRLAGSTIGMDSR